MQEKQIAGLKYLETRESAAYTVILCHGYGASMHDLAPLADVLDPKKEFRWIFPQAPYEIHPGYSAWAWFDLNIPLLEESFSKTADSAYLHYEPEGLTDAAGMLLEFIRALKIPQQTLFTGGFSQGSMVSLDAALTTSFLPIATILMSGTLVNMSAWSKGAQSKKNLYFFQSHGVQDPVLPHSRALKLKELLTKHGHHVQWEEFAGGHAIPQDTALVLSQFIRSMM